MKCADSVQFLSLSAARYLAWYLRMNRKKRQGMKHFLILILAVVPLLTVAQQKEKVAIHSAIETGDAKALGAHLAKGVDLSLKDVEGVYSKDQSVQILHRFFSDNPPSLFKMVHEGTSKSDDFFYIGDLQTSRGRYRVTYFLKKSDDVFVIKQLRIESRD